MFLKIKLAFKSCYHVLKTYNNKLLYKIQETFSGLEQQLFITSFYCYLNYDKSNDYVIDLDNIWKWLGFKQKVKAVSLLEKYFIIDIDYKKTAPHFGGADLNKKNVAFVETKASLNHNILLSHVGKQDDK